MISETFTKRDMPKIMAMIAGFFGSCADEKQYTVEIKEFRKRRSLDANAYYWVLAHKIAAAANVEVSTVYREHIKEIGGNNEIVCVLNKGVDDFCEAWERNGIGWIAERMPSKLEGCTNVMCYFGSSTYDTLQMSRLIGLAIQDCKEYGIEYMSERELGALLASWGDDRNGCYRFPLQAQPSRWKA